MLSKIFNMPALNIAPWEDLSSDVLLDLFEVYDADIDYSKINEDRYGQKLPCRLVCAEKISRRLCTDTLVQVSVLSMDNVPFAILYNAHDFKKLFVSDMGVLKNAQDYVQSYKNEGCRNFIVLDGEHDDKLKEFAGDLEMRIIDGGPKLTHSSDYTQGNDASDYVLDYDKRDATYEKIVKRHTPGRDDPITMKAAACAFYYHLLDTIPAEDKFVLNLGPKGMHLYFPGLISCHDLCAIVFRKNGGIYLITTPTNNGNNHDWRYENAIYPADDTRIFEELRLLANPIPDKLKAIYFQDIASCAS